MYFSVEHLGVRNNDMIWIYFLWIMSIECVEYLKNCLQYWVGTQPLLKNRDMFTRVK